MNKKSFKRNLTVDNSPPATPQIDTEIIKKVQRDLLKEFDYLFPNKHSPYMEFINRWYLPVSFKACLERKESHINKMNNDPFPEIRKNKIAQCDTILLFIIDKWIEHDLDLIDEMKDYKPFKSIDEQPDHELDTAHKIIKKQRNDNQSLRLKMSYSRGELSDEEIEKIAEKTRFKNGNLNYTSFGKQLGITRQTAKKLIIDRKLTYLNNPPESK